MSKIIIEFEDSEYDGSFFNDVKRSIEISTYKPENVKMIMEEEIE